MIRKIIEKYSEKQEGLFKTFYITFLFGCIPFALMHIIFNLIGIMPVNFNGEKVYGLLGVLVILMFLPLMALLFTVIIWLYFMIGNLLLRLLKKTIL